MMGRQTPFTQLMNTNPKHLKTNQERADRKLVRTFVTALMAPSNKIPTTLLSSVAKKIRGALFGSYLDVVITCGGKEFYGADVDTVFRTKAVSFDNIEVKHFDDPYLLSSGQVNLDVVWRSLAQYVTDYPNKARPLQTCSQCGAAFLPKKQAPKTWKVSKFCSDECKGREFYLRKKKERKRA